MKPNRRLVNDPFFIFYDSRSGSTFLANLLIKNADVVIPPDSNFISKIIVNYPKSSIDDKQDLKRILEIIYGDRKFGDWGIEEAIIRKEIEDCLPISIRDFLLSICAFYKENNSPESEILGIKKGGYTQFHRKIRELFPKSRFIGLIRDGRAVFNSKKHSLYSRTGKPFETNPLTAAKVWCENLRLLEEIRSSYRDDSLIIYYERLVKDTEKTLSSVCDFLDINYTPDSASKNKKYFVSKRYGDLHKNIEKPTLPARISAWRKSLSNAEIFAFEWVAYDQLLSKGYTLVNSYRSLKYLKSIYNLGDYIRFHDKRLDRLIIKKIWDLFLR